MRGAGETGKYENCKKRDLSIQVNTVDYTLVDYKILHVAYSIKLRRIYKLDREQMNFNNSFFTLPT